MSRRLTLFMLLFLILATWPCTAGAEGVITGSGCSVSVPGYLSDLAKAYEKESGVKVLVLGGGSVRGLEDLKEGRMDFAASCASRTPDSTGDFDYVPASWDALVFIVNRKNPVDTISPDQVRAIYDGKNNNWKELGGPDLNLISIISAARGKGGIGESLSKMVLNGAWPEKQKNSSLQASSTAIWEQIVEDMPEAFASTGFGSARKRNVKMLKVNGVAPTKENIISGKYPFRRPLYLVTKKDPKPEVKRFLEFVVSPKGQKLISSFGMPSLRDVMP